MTTKYVIALIAAFMVSTPALAEHEDADRVSAIVTAEADADTGFFGRTWHGIKRIFGGDEVYEDHGKAAHERQKDREEAAREWRKDREEHHREMDKAHAEAGREHAQKEREHAKKLDEKEREAYKKHEEESRKAYE
jgi:hypothetical protein